MRELIQRERAREVAHRGEKRRALLGTPSNHLCQTLLYGGVYIGGWGKTLPPTKETRGAGG
jgi:hypothetical protein